MAPIFEQRATSPLAPGGLIEQIAIVVTEAGEQREVMRAHQRID